MGKDRFTSRLIRVGALLSAAAAAIGFWNAPLALGVFAGAWWNAASLWCLTHLLTAWLGPAPSRRRAVGWLLVKFPLLYAVVFVFLRAPALSAIGFGLGFSAVLVGAIGSLIPHAPPLATTRSYGH